MTIKIDDISVPATGGARSTKIIGVLPGDFSAAQMTAWFQRQGPSLEATNLQINQAELEKPTEDLAGTLVTALKWREVHS